MKILDPVSFFFLLLSLSLSLSGCESKGKETGYNMAGQSMAQSGTKLKNVDTFDQSTKTIHVLVALCDNTYQGIVPVPEKIGNGQNPDQNLYWGAAYGVRTYFSKSKEWKLLKTEKKDSIRMERLIFQNVSNKNYYLVADAYDGQYIKITVNNTKIGIYGNSRLVSYVGHDGLMDFQPSESFKNQDGKTRDCIILACYSKKFFSRLLQETQANPLVWTSHLMAPEAYILHDALTGYLHNETGEQIRSRAALAYSRYQYCILKYILPTIFPRLHHPDDSDLLSPLSSEG